MPEDTDDITGLGVMHLLEAIRRSESRTWLKSWGRSSRMSAGISPAQEECPVGPHSSAPEPRVTFPRRPQLWTSCVFVLLVAGGPTLAPGGASEAGVKRLIYYGWGVRDTQYVRDHWREMEEMPFDGTGIVVAIDRSKLETGGTGNQLGWQVMGPRAFQIEEFREAIEDLRTARWRRFTENFLPVALSSSVSAEGLTWFDDERWRTIVNNFGVVARIAREAGLRGLILDPEHYNYALFSYPSQRQKVDKPFAAYRDAARMRGRQVMTAIAAHLPRAVLLSLFGYTLPLREVHRGRSIEEANYGLLPAFYDGLLEAMPAGATLVDGYEFAYPFKRRGQFIKAYREIHDEAVTLSAVPEEYRKKVKAGFGLWLDYGNRPDFFTPDEFRQAVASALEVSDGYVWLYTQRVGFFPLSEIAPAYLDAIATARQGGR
ncbi:hypothetical protein HRbin11_01432 [bacterium HR11]|nr:hypothetical protein HRbin11_01432 [bacterium HR11]